MSPRRSTGAERSHRSRDSRASGCSRADISICSLSRPATPGARLDGQLRRRGYRRDRSSSARRATRAAPTQIIPSGFGDALGSLGNGRAPTWNFRLNFSYPIGTSPAGSRDRASPRAAAQTIAQSRATRAADRDRGHERRAARGSEPRAHAGSTGARELAQHRLEAEQSRFEVGLSTNFFVVQAQRDLRDAQNTELRALLDYRRRRWTSNACRKPLPTVSASRQHLPGRRRHGHAPTRAVVAARRMAGLAKGEAASKGPLIGASRPVMRKRSSLPCLRRLAGVSILERPVGRWLLAEGARRWFEGRGGGGPRRGGWRWVPGGGFRRRWGRGPLTVELARCRAVDDQEIVVVGNLIGEATVAVVPRTAGRLQDVSSGSAIA